MQGNCSLNGDKGKSKRSKNKTKQNRHKTNKQKNLEVLNLLKARSKSSLLRQTNLRHSSFHLPKLENGTGELRHTPLRNCENSQIIRPFAY